ncbi:DUF6381 family protein [Streptomyces wuyuanensis]|uniref:Small hydrophilic protein n=1 Tax=Streptomyces wuyuanensis TaxID=1196353 RepID=A0A1H0CAA0_9ACTN|nr:DUF6381 family protein [Streptomyces wuyuanensis]SDN54757.1 hypothetical protein SAMN05444921_12990 [Streptomyces wuyuanensis]
MSTAREPVRTSEELRLMADELTRGAERCKDPEHRERLHRRAEELRRQCDAGDASEDMAPVHARQEPYRPQQRGTRGPQGRRADRPHGT